jgi:RpiR family carbohydrate utilization transcriptional regulator
VILHSETFAQWEGLQNLLLAEIRARYPMLSKSEKQVADTILRDSDQVLKMTLADLGVASGVSDATVVRFYRAMGLDSYLELKLALSQSVSNTSTLIHDDLTAEDSPTSIAHKVFQSSIQAITDTQLALKPAAFEHAVGLIENARRVLIIGVGTSAPLAHELANRLFRLRIRCEVETESLHQLMKAALLTGDDVCIAISQSGESNNPIRTVCEARSHGCSVIAITGNSASPLARNADVVLLSVSHESRTETIASRIAQHALIQALYVALAMKSVESTNQAERLIWDALMKDRYRDG